MNVSRFLLVSLSFVILDTPGLSDGPPWEQCLIETLDSCADIAKVPCTKLSCTHDHNELIEFQNPDGTSGFYIREVWKCRGTAASPRVGYYENSVQPYHTEPWDPINHVNRTRAQIAQVPEDVYCFSKAGCPVEGCEEFNDPNLPGAFVWRCSDPPETTYVNDETSKKTSTRIDSDFPCFPTTSGG